MTASIPAGAHTEVRLLSLPVREALATAHDAAPPQDRELVVVRIEHGGVVGWGECSALNRPTYTNEFARGAFALLSGSLATGTPVDVSDAPMAAAAVESAVLDLQLRATNTSLAQWIGAQTHAAVRPRVPAGAALGRAPESALAARAQELAAAGFVRIKLKIVPGHVHEPIAVVRKAAPDVALHVDGNGSFGPDHIDVLASMVGEGVSSFEQPFAPQDVASAAALIERVDVPVVADEAVDSLKDLQHLHGCAAATAVSLKVAKIGGLARALEVAVWCINNGVAITAGGMLESGLGRHQMAAMAAPEWSSIIGDVSPARRWLGADPWPDLEMVDGHVMTPTAAGIAPAPDQDLLERFTVERAAFR